MYIIVSFIFLFYIYSYAKTEGKTLVKLYLVILAYYFGYNLYILSYKYFHSVNNRGTFTMSKTSVVNIDKDQKGS